MREFWLKSYDDTDIYVTLWDDVAALKGVIQLVHGMGEYARRYDELAEFFNGRGYIVFADDHRAHGRTEKPENLGKHYGDVFVKTLHDELFFREWLKGQYELPIFMLGHSYGSFLAQAFAQAGTDIKAIALTGSGHMKSRFSAGAALIAPLKLFAPNWRPKFVEKMGAKMYRYDGEEGKNLWLNSVPERRAEFDDDPLVHVPMSVNFYYSMMRNTSKLYSKRALGRLNPMTAIGIFSGDGDPLGEYGKGVKRLDDMYRSVGIQSELHLYEGARHEVAYDRCCEQVREDIAEFFDRFVMYHQTTIYEIMNEEENHDDEYVW